MASRVEVGQKAPDFELPDQDGQPVRLSEVLRQGPVMLVFYPGDFSPVCTRQLCSYRDHYEEFRELGFQILGISDDPVERHARFRQRQSLPFSLLSDRDHQVIDEYTGSGLLSAGGANRGNFLFDTDQVVRYAHVEKIGLFRRKPEELLEAARSLLDPE